MFYFRADGNAVTGAGHLMRCLTIAEELKKLLEAGKLSESGKLPETAAGICFICADEASAELVSQSGFPVQVLHTDYLNLEEELPVWAELFGSGQKPVCGAQELAEQAQERSGRKVAEHVILVDSYHVTDAYLEALRSYGRVYLLDDMGKKAYPVDGVINYNAFADEAHYEKLYQGKSTQLAVGSSFVPVRRQFLDVPYEVREQVKEVLITTGGGDNDNIAAAVFQAIGRPECRYHVIVGQFNRHFLWWKQLEQECSQVQVHHNVTDMASLMRQCDMAVTAGGTTIYELAAIGVPFLCFSYAENQEALTEYIGSKKIAGYCGAYHLNKQETLSRMSRLAEEISISAQTAADEGTGVELRRRMYEREKEMIDGLGACRIAQLLTDR